MNDLHNQIRAGQANIVYSDMLFERTSGEADYQVHQSIILEIGFIQNIANRNKEGIRGKLKRGYNGL